MGALCLSPTNLIVGTHFEEVSAEALPVLLNHASYGCGGDRKAPSVPHQHHVVNVDRRAACAGYAGGGTEPFRIPAS